VARPMAEYPPSPKTSLIASMAMLLSMGYYFDWCRNMDLARRRVPGRSHFFSALPVLRAFAAGRSRLRPGGSPRKSATWQDLASHASAAVQ
jgi:hypothetical protein